MPTNCRPSWISLLLGLLAASVSPARGGERRTPPYTEEERRAEYIRRGHTFPPKIQPDTKGWNHILTRRFQQVQAIKDPQQKWDGFIQTLSASLLQNYTEFGWGLTQGPAQLTEDIREAIYDGLPDAESEGKIDVIDGPAPLMIIRPDLTQRVSVSKIILFCLGVLRRQMILLDSCL